MNAMPDVNYIKHLNAVYDQFQKDSRLNPTHISLYMALFQYWNHHRFPEQFQINREEIMKLAKVGSKSTYHRVLKELTHWKYIIYLPSHNPFKGSKIKMLIFGTSTEQAVDQPMYQAVPKLRQAVGRINKHNKPIQTNKNESKRTHPQKEQVVIDFFKKNKWPAVEAQKFFNHYQANGWKVGGKTEMKDWHASAKKWMLNYKEQLSQIKDKSNVSPSMHPTSAARGMHTKGADNLHTNRNKNYDEPL